MQGQKHKVSLRSMVLVGILSALVFALSHIQVPVTLPFGEVSRIHLGNIMCILSGILFGPLTGGLSAGLGSMLYDFTDPRFLPEFWLTFIMKFAMGFLAGWLANRPLAKLPAIPRALLSALAGQLLYTALFLTRSAFYAHLVNNVPWQGVWVVVATSALVSLLSGTMTVLACTLLAPPLGAALKASGFFKQKPRPHTG